MLAQRATLTLWMCSGEQYQAPWEQLHHIDVGWPQSTKVSWNIVSDDVNEPGWRPRGLERLQPSRLQHPGPQAIRPDRLMSTHVSPQTSRTHAGAENYGI